MKKPQKARGPRLDGCSVVFGFRLGVSGAGIRFIARILCQPCHQATIIARRFWKGVSTLPPAPGDPDGLRAQRAVVPGPVLELRYSLLAIGCCRRSRMRSRN